MGRGCLAYEGEAEKDMKRSFDNPIMVIKIDEGGNPDKEAFEILKNFLGKEALEKAMEQHGLNGVSVNAAIAGMQFQVLQDKRKKE